MLGWIFSCSATPFRLNNEIEYNECFHSNEALAILVCLGFMAIAQLPRRIYIRVVFRPVGWASLPIKVQANRPVSGTPSPCCYFYGKVWRILTVANKKHRGNTFAPMFF